MVKKPKSGYIIIYWSLYVFLLNEGKTHRKDLPGKDTVSQTFEYRG